MALPLDISNLDLYSAVFQFLGVTNLSGDPVRDAVYKLLLPMVVVFLFIQKVIGESRFGGTKAELIISFITAFIIIYEGYFAIFADLSIYLLGIIILWHTLGFIFGGGKNKREEGGTKARFGFGTQPGSGGTNWVKTAVNAKETVKSMEAELSNINKSGLKERKRELKELNGAYLVLLDKIKNLDPTAPDAGRTGQWYSSERDKMEEKAKKLIRPEDSDEPGIPHGDAKGLAKELCSAIGIH